MKAGMVGGMGQEFAAHGGCSQAYLLILPPLTGCLSGNGYPLLPAKALRPGCPALRRPALNGGGCRIGHVLHLPGADLHDPLGKLAHLAGPVRRPVVSAYPKLRGSGSDRNAAPASNCTSTAWF